MFSDDDFGLAEVRAIALGYPEAHEKVSHGRPGFFVSKMFAMYGGSTKQSGPMTSVPHCLLVKVDESERPALQAADRFFVPAYLGPSGWLGLDFAAADVDWDEVRELVDASYRAVAPKRLVDKLDGL
jgi:hypothetical protein